VTGFDAVGVLHRFDEQTLFGLAGHDRRPVLAPLQNRLAVVERKGTARFVGLRRMATVTVFDQQRADLLFEVRGGRGVRPVELLVHRDLERLLEPRKTRPADQADDRPDLSGQADCLAGPAQHQLPRQGVGKRKLFRGRIQPLAEREHADGVPIGQQLTDVNAHTATSRHVPGRAHWLTRVMIHAAGPAAGTGHVNSLYGRHFSVVNCSRRVCRGRRRRAGRPGDAGSPHLLGENGPAALDGRENARHLTLEAPEHVEGVRGGLSPCLRGFPRRRLAHLIAGIASQGASEGAAR